MCTLFRIILIYFEIQFDRLLTSWQLHQVSIIPSVHCFQKLLNIPKLHVGILVFVQKQFVDNQRNVCIQRGVVKDSTDLQSVT